MMLRCNIVTAYCDILQREKTSKQYKKIITINNIELFVGSISSNNDENNNDENNNNNNKHDKHFEILCGNFKIGKCEFS